MNSEFENTYAVYFPLELKDEKYTGPLYGYYVPETRIFNVISTVPHPTNANVRLLGYICRELQESPEELTGYFDENGTLSFRHRGRRVVISYYSLVRELFSRNTGILESSLMLKKRAVIIGCGSGGSLIAVELAKSGVGRFLLIDDDVFSYHNIIRHQLGIYDVGKFKVDALKERLLSINPNLDVAVFPTLLQKISLEDISKYLDGDTILINASDMRSSAHYANYLSERYNVPFVAAAGGIRAATGELFWYIPGKGMPCYACAFGQDTHLDTSNRVSRRIAYANEETIFQPGIAADLDYINIIAVKLIIDLLMKDEPGYYTRLLSSASASTSVGVEKLQHPLQNGMRQCTFLCNYPAATADEKNPEHPNYNSIQQLFRYPLGIVTMPSIRQDGCYLCRKMREQ